MVAKRKPISFSSAGGGPLRRHSKSKSEATSGGASSSSGSGVVVEFPAGVGKSGSGGGGSGKDGDDDDGTAEMIASPWDSASAMEGVDYSLDLVADLKSPDREGVK